MTEALTAAYGRIVSLVPMSYLRSALIVPVGFFFVSAGAVVFMAISLVLLPWRALRVKAANLYGKIVGRIVFWLAGIKTEKVGFEKLQGQYPAIYVSNHTSTMDGPLAMWVCPFGGAGVAKKELARIPFFGWLYMLSGHLLIDRANRTKAVKSMAELSRVVKEHELGIWIWPEGTRSRSGRLLPFKKGFAHLALATGLPVVPVVVSGAQKIWSKGSLVINPARIRIEVLDAIETSDWEIESLDAHIDEVRQAFLELLPEEQLPEAVLEATAGDPAPLRRAANA